MIRGFQTMALATVTLSSASAAQERQADPEILPGIPTSALPPEGMCRVWLKDVPVGRQPAPTDCASAIKTRPRDAILLIGEQGKNAKGPARSSVNSMTRNQANDDLFNRRRTTNLLPAERANLEHQQQQRASVAQRAGQPAGSAQVPAGATAAVKAPEAKAAVVKPPE